MVQWLRSALQGTPVRPLTQEDPTCLGATKPVHHNYWARALEPGNMTAEPMLPRTHAPEKRSLFCPSSSWAHSWTSPTQSCGGQQGRRAALGYRLGRKRSQDVQEGPKQPPESSFKPFPSSEGHMLQWNRRGSWVTFSVPFMLHWLSPWGSGVLLNHSSFTHSH